MRVEEEMTEASQRFFLACTKPVQVVFHELYVSLHEFHVVFREFHVFSHEFHLFFMNHFFS